MRAWDSLGTSRLGGLLEELGCNYSIPTSTPPGLGTVFWPPTGIGGLWQGLSCMARTGEIIQIPSEFI